ncbi:MAG: REP-associated tyrosine transposase [bacterium]
MARPLRIEYEGAFYHITARGDEGREIYQSRSDYDRFKGFLKEARDKYSCIVHCYVLMRNHYHLLLETPKANLSKIMHSINSSYTTYFNNSKNQNGHMFQGRYKACLVEPDSYLLELSRYVHLNPVRAEIAERPEDYPYSSYRSYIQKDREDLVYRNLIWEMIAKGKQKDGVNRYKEFVDSTKGRVLTNPLKHAHSGMILGEKAFIKMAKQRLKGMNMIKRDSPRPTDPHTFCNSDSFIDRICSYFGKSMDDLFNEKGEPRNIALYLVKKYTSLSNKEIGNLFGNISYSAVAKVYQRFRQKITCDPELAEKVKAITEYLFSLSDDKN